MRRLRWFSRPIPAESQFVFPYCKLFLTTKTVLITNFLSLIANSMKNRGTFSTALKYILHRSQRFHCSRGRASYPYHPNNKRMIPRRHRYNNSRPHRPYRYKRKLSIPPQNRCRDWRGCAAFRRRPSNRGCVFRRHYNSRRRISGCYRQKMLILVKDMVSPWKNWMMNFCFVPCSQ